MHDDGLIDGVPAEAGWLSDRALQFGDGLFETIAVVDAQPCLWDLHMARLAEGCRRLALPPPDFELLAREARPLCAGRARAVLKLFWTAGSSARGYRRPVPLAPRRMLRVSDWPAPADAWSLRLCRHRLSENPALAQIKHLNRLDQVIARAEWDDPATAEGLMLDQAGRVIGGTMSNLFLQQGDRLITPPIEGAGIAGVVRQLALRLGERSGRPVQVSHVTPDQVRAAQAVYLTNALIGVVCVGRFDETEYQADQPLHPLMHEARTLCHRPGWGGLGLE